MYNKPTKILAIVKIYFNKPVDKIFAIGRKITQRKEVNLEQVCRKNFYLRK